MYQNNSYKAFLTWVKFSSEDNQPRDTGHSMGMVILRGNSEPFSNKCHIWCRKEYTDKNEKQVTFYVNIDSVEAFSDT